MKRTSRVALGGIVSAAASVVLLLTIFPFATYALPPLAGALLIPLVIECGKRWALCAYAAVSFISLLIVPDIEAKMLFVAFFGYYPIVKASIESIQNRVWEWIAKLLVFNTAAVVGYTILTWIGFSLEVFRIEGITLPLSVFLFLFLLTGNVIFVIYDIGLTRALPQYLLRLQPLIQKML